MPPSTCRDQQRRQEFLAQRPGHGAVVRLRGGRLRVTYVHAHLIAEIGLAFAPASNSRLKYLEWIGFASRPGFWRTIPDENDSRKIQNGAQDRQPAKRRGSRAGPPRNQCG